MKLLIASILCLCSFPVVSAPKSCADYVDYLRLFYINGMFTPYTSYLDNKRELTKFQDKYLNSGIPSAGAVKGSYNNDEAALLQVLQVTRQKLEDKSESSEELDHYFDILSQFLTGNVVTVGALNYEILLYSLAEALGQFLPEINQDRDYMKAYIALSSVMEGCSRTILISHSQGNFYGNSVVESFYSQFTFPGGWRLSQYPMLGQVGVANPSEAVAGDFGGNNENLVGHLTNDNDLIMLGVRNIIGSITSNYDAEFNTHDWSGHGLIDSYLLSSGQASNLANQILNIAMNMTPVPVYNQTLSNSSAFSSYGSSKKSQTLDLKFIDGGLYRYRTVPVSVIEEFDAALSKGQYFNINIRGVYNFESIAHSASRRL